MFNETTAAKLTNHMLCEGLFYHYMTEWKKQSRFMSSVAQKTELQPYVSIIELGISIVPYLMDKIERAKRILETLK